MVTCSNCGESAPSGDRIYCPSCGAELPAAEPTTSGRSTTETTESDQSRSPAPSGSQPDATSSRQHSGRDGPGRTQRNRTQSGTETTNTASTTDATARTGRSSQPNQSPQQSPERPPQQSGSEHRSQRSGESQSRQSTTRAQDTANGQRANPSNGTLLGGSSRRTSEPAVNELAWAIGWRPFPTIGAVAVVFLALALLAELSAGGIVAVTLVGAGLGAGIWYWGVKEINDNYSGFRSAFFGSSAKRAESRLGIDESEVIDTFDFRSHTGNSPPLVEPSKHYRADHMVLSDVSVSVDKDSMYNMKERDTKSTGTTKNIYYDNIESITTNDEGHRTYLRIVTSRGENLQAATVDQRVAEQAQGRLRSKMRDVRRARH